LASLWSKANGLTIRQRSDWRDIYRNRVSSFALTLVTEGHPVIFVGLPPMGDPALNEDIRLINQMIEEAVAPTRARFVSVYAGFADLAGQLHPRRAEHGRPGGGPAAR
jgi:hypothetical protein